jgi:hypothetical protein
MNGIFAKQEIHPIIMQTEIPINEERKIFEIYEMQDGKVTGIRLDGKIYHLESGNGGNGAEKHTNPMNDWREKIIQELKAERIPVEQLTIITRQNNTPIYQEALIYLNEQLIDEFTKEEFTDTIIEFYRTMIEPPKTLKKSTMETYASAYKSYLYDYKFIEYVDFDKYRLDIDTRAIRKKEQKQAKEPLRSPHDTMLFLSWIENNNIREFRIEDFTKEYPQISLEHAEKIMAHQIALNKIWQNGDKLIVKQEAS